MVTSCGDYGMPHAPEGHNGHLAGCMCDKCIIARNKAKAESREREARSRPYIQRRGGEIGTISVRQALKGRKP